MLCPVSSPMFITIVALTYAFFSLCSSAFSSIIPPRYPWTLLDHDPQFPCLFCILLSSMLSSRRHRQTIMHFFFIRIPPNQAV